MTWPDHSDRHAGAIPEFIDEIKDARRTAVDRQRLVTSGVAVLRVRRRCRAFREDFLHHTLLLAGLDECMIRVGAR